MSNDDKYVALFLSEGRDLVEEMGLALRDLLGGNTEARNALFRSAHSLKGMAASVGLKQVSRLAHAMEDAFQCLAGQEQIPDKELADLLWQGVDALAESLDRVGDGVEERSLNGFSQAIRTWVSANHSKVIPTHAETVPVEVLDALMEESSDFPEEFPSSQANVELRLKLTDDVELPAARLAVLCARISALATILGTEGDAAPGGSISFQLDTSRTAKDVAALLRGEEGVASVEARPIALPPAIKTDRMVRVPAEIMDLLLEESTEILVHHAHLERLAPETETPEIRFALARLKTTASRLFLASNARSGILSVDWIRERS